MQGESKYAMKFASGKQMYGPGCCAHKLQNVEINTETRFYKDGRALVVARTPSKFLPRFTDQKTRR